MTQSPSDSLPSAIGPSIAEVDAYDYHGASRARWYRAPSCVKCHRGITDLSAAVVVRADGAMVHLDCWRPKPQVTP
jgi:hypothetical protein